jgi:hypothetical protein
MPHNLVPTRNAIRKTPGEISSIYGVARSAHSSMPVKGPRRQSLRSRRGRAWCASGLFDAFGYCPRRDASARVPCVCGSLSRLGGNRMHLRIHEKPHHGVRPKAPFWINRQREA